MSIAQLIPPINLFLGILYALILGSTFLRGPSVRGANGLRLYVGMGLLVTFGVVLFRQLHWPGWMDVTAWDNRLERGTGWHLLLFGSFTQAVFLCFIAFEVLGGRRLSWAWFLLVGGWLAGLLCLEFGWISLPETIIVNPGWQIEKSRAAPALTVTAWGLFTGQAAIRIYQATKWGPSPRLKNQAIYLTLALFILTVSDAILFSNSVAASGAHLSASLVRITGVATLGYAVLVDPLPAFHRVNQMVLKHLVAVLLALLFYATGFLILEWWLGRMPGYHPLLPATLLALILAIFFEPLVSFSQGLVKGLFASKSYDMNKIVSEYSQSISNVLDMQLVATVLVGISRAALDSVSGQLFLVEPEVNPEGQRFFRLRFAGSQSLGPKLKDRPGAEMKALAASVALFERGAIAATFLDQRRVLQLSELESQPAFRSASQAEVSWLADVQAEIYVPIFAKEDWIGLLVLGVRETGEPYSEDDQALLQALANQTAVALQNIRLVEGLVRLNNDFRRAYSAMDLVNRQLERLDRTKSDFISIASHELRTPLTLISGYNQMLLDESALRAHPVYATMLSGIQSGTDRLSEIIESLLDMALVDTRTLEIHPEPVSLSESIMEICANLQAAISERSLQLEVIGLEALPMIEADLKGVQKIFYHLIINAIKYTPDGGRITITGQTCSDPNRSQIAGNLSAEAVELMVADTGIGIDSGYQELIFNKFFQTGAVSLHSSGKTKFKGGGPGLGLAIVKGIVEVHNGRVWVESPGYDETKFPGSCFHVVLSFHQIVLHDIQRFDQETFEKLHQSNGRIPEL